MAIAMTLAPAYAYRETQSIMAGPRSLKFPMAHEVRTEDVQQRIIEGRVKMLMHDAIDEAQEFGDPLPEERAWEKVVEMVGGAAKHIGARDFTLPLIGIMSDGRIEVSIPSSGRVPSGSTFIVSKDGEWAKFLLTSSDPAAEPVSYEFPLR